MYQLTTLENGLTLITVPIPHLDSVTTLVAVGAGSRYETRKINGISHFLEHMFFKGSKKYPSAELISTLIDGIGAINNAATSKEFTYYWVKSASKHIELSIDILSSMLKDSLLADEEIEKEKGVIVEEMRMIRDNPRRYVWDLYEKLQYGDQPLGWDIGGEEETILSFNRDDFVSYVDSLYSPKNMVLVLAGKLPKNIKQLAEKYLSDLPSRYQHKFVPFKNIKQSRPKVNIYYKKTDQANLILGVAGYSYKQSKKRYIADVLETILGQGMSSRLFIQVREKRGLAYTVDAENEFFQDTGSFKIHAGLKLEKVGEGLEVIVAELMRTVSEEVTDQELKKAKEMIRGRLAIRSESTNFLAVYFGSEFVLNHEIETFEEYLKKIDQVSAEDIRQVASELFNHNRFNLQVIGPFRSAAIFAKALS